VFFDDILVYSPDLQTPLSHLSSRTSQSKQPLREAVKMCLCSSQGGVFGTCY
jgi:hypothetical protein